MGDPDLSKAYISHGNPPNDCDLMQQYMPIQISVANDTADEVNPDEFYRCIETNLGDVQTYWIDPDKTRGRIVSAAIDYVILLPVVYATVGTISAFVDIYSAVEIIYKIHNKFFPKGGPAALIMRLPDGTQIVEKKDNDQLYMRHPDGTEIMRMKDDNGQSYVYHPHGTKTTRGEDDSQFYMRRPDGTEILISGKEHFVKEIATSIIEIDKKRDAFEKPIEEVVAEVNYYKLWSRRK